MKRKELTFIDLFGAPGGMSSGFQLSKKLRSQGYSVLNFWEHDVNRSPEKCLGRIERKAGHKKKS